MGKPVIQRALPGEGGKGGGKESLIKQRKVPDSKLPPGWTGVPISLANQPGTGLIPGLCWVISSLVHLLLCLMSPSPLRGAFEGVLCFSVCTTVYCLNPHPQSCCVPVGSCAERAVPVSDPKLSFPVLALLLPHWPPAADGCTSPPCPTNL